MKILKHSGKSSRVKNLLKIDLKELVCFVFPLTSYYCLSVFKLPSHSSSKYFQVIITVLIEHLHGFFDGKTSYHQ